MHNPHSSMTWIILLHLLIWKQLILYLGGIFSRPYQNIWNVSNNFLSERFVESGISSKIPYSVVGDFIFWSCSSNRASDIFSLNRYWLFSTKVSQRNLQTLAFLFHIHTVWPEIDITFRLTLSFQMTLSYKNAGQVDFQVTCPAGRVAVEIVEACIK